MSTPESPATTDYPVAPIVAARVLASVLIVSAILIIVATIAVAALNLHTVVLLIPVILVLLVIVAGWRQWETRRWLMRATDEGYRVQWVRGVGTDAARWKDVEDAVATTVAGSEVVMLRLRDGRTTTIPVDMLAMDREQFVREIQQHLERGSGLRKL